MIIKDWLKTASSIIQSSSPMLDAELLLCHHINKNRAYLLAFSDETISNEILAELDKKLKKLKTGYPLAYILGQRDFWDMTLSVTEDTLIPRADTETLIETCQEILPAKFTGNILDLGTGSGAIAIALNRVFPNAHITATDISTNALKVAKENAKIWQNTPITFIHANWFIYLGNEIGNKIFSEHQFDVIVSNPPYIKENDPHLSQLTHEPITALTAPDNGLADIKNIIINAKTYLKPCGWLLLEHGYNQGNVIRDYFSSTNNWRKAQTIPDLANNERITVAQLKN